jgi:hypothetical protein
MGKTKAEGKQQELVFIERVLKVFKGKRLGAARLRVFQPERSDNEDKNVWVCRYEVVGSRILIRDPALGQDGLQALTNGLRAVAADLDMLGKEIGWFDPGDVGLPLFVGYHNLDFRSLVTSLIETEHMRFAMAGARPARRAKTRSGSIAHKVIRRND